MAAFHALCYALDQPASSTVRSLFFASHLCFLDWHNLYTFLSAGLLSYAQGNAFIKRGRYAQSIHVRNSGMNRIHGGGMPSWAFACLDALCDQRGVDTQVFVIGTPTGRRAGIFTRVSDLGDTIAVLRLNVQPLKCATTCGLPSLSTKLRRANTFHWRADWQSTRSHVFQQATRMCVGGEEVLTVVRNLTMLPDGNVDSGAYAWRMGTNALAAEEREPPSVWWESEGENEGGIE